MAKEIENLQQLETQRDSLSTGIGRIRDVYLSDPIRIGRVEVGSSFSATLEVGMTKAAARKAIVGLNSRLEQVNNELGINDEARAYLNRVNQMEHGLDEMNVLVAEGNLPEDILRKHQQEFEELQLLPSTNPLLQRGLDRIKQEEEAKKSVEKFPELSTAIEISETQTVQSSQQTDGKKNIEYPPQSSITSVATVDKRLLLTRKVVETFKSVVRSAPDEILDDIVNLLAGRGDVARQELAEVATLVIAYREGKITSPTPSDFLNARNDEEKQLEYVQITLRGILAQLILRDGEFQQSSQGLKARIGRATNELMFFLGQRNGKQMIIESLSRLSITERTLLLKSMSTNLKKNLGFPDLDECDEFQMSAYIEVVTYEPNVKRRQESGMRRESRIELIQMLDACVERINTGFNVRKVLDQLSENDASEIIFSTMIDACETESALDLLESFFMQHEETHEFAKECRNRRQEEKDFIDYDE